MTIGKIPAVWKRAVVIPIFKKGNPSDPANYRPISLTCVPCRVLESLIRDVMLSHLTDHTLLSADQFGFLPGRSTTLQLLMCLDSWTFALDAGAPVDIIFIDFAKAFDSVSHAKLLQKLKFYGFSGSLLDWISDCLADRTQAVSVSGVMSELTNVTSGVPQGSVLGPLLFILFINDLSCEEYNIDAPKFADDVLMHNAIISQHDQRNLQGALGHVECWSNASQLPIADTKCSVLHLGSANAKYNYLLFDNILTHQSLVKDLGVWFSTDLKVGYHCKTIVMKANQRAAIIKRVFVSGDVFTLCWAFKVYVRPILEYASHVWSPHLVKDIDCVESVQRYFTKYLPGMSRLSYNDRLRHLGLESLELRRLKADLLFTYNLLHDKLAVPGHYFFSVRGMGRTRGHPLKLTVNMSHLDCRKFFFCNRVVGPWNQLPADTVMAPSILSFKRGLESFDLSNFIKYS